MADERIPGTRVPDTPIHRASLWLEDLKYAERRRADPGVERMGDTVEFFAREVPIATPEQLEEAAAYYGTNLYVMLTMGKIEFQIPSPTGEGFINLRDILISTWLDGFMHGGATAVGKQGLSVEEEDRGK